MANPN